MTTSTLLFLKRVAIAATAAMLIGGCAKPADPVAQEIAQTQGELELAANDGKARKPGCATRLSKLGREE